MNIQIFGQIELEEYIKKGGKIYSHCISITNPKPCKMNNFSHIMPEIFKSSFNEILELKFWDSDKKDNGYKIPEKQDIINVLNFIERTKNQATGYTIHCWHGISRSSAIGFGILQYFYKDEQIASEKLLQARIQAMPLKLIVEYFDEILNSNLSNFKETVYREKINLIRKKYRGLN